MNVDGTYAIVYYNMKKCMCVPRCWPTIDNSNAQRKGLIMSNKEMETIASLLLHL